MKTREIEMSYLLNKNMKKKLAIVIKKIEN